MVSRGSTIPHVGRASNPFMTTSSSIVGINLAEKVRFEVPVLLTEKDCQDAGIVKPGKHLKDFMYQTTNETYGRVNEAEKRSTISQRMDKSSVEQEVREKGLVELDFVPAPHPHEFSLCSEDLMPARIDTKMLSEGRKEHPMFATSHRVIGADKTKTNLEMDRRGRPSGFTPSFHGFRYRDCGLNTSISRSRVCDQLDG
uniref:Uncharacterized protein AlNc14C153G7567 n=1 Tax=Albugo laibachii Nc14 TaxID=890382 RepID=F0WM64_9STRA|nr:conserved hypothetical protein [Albugo laibachii Nc14]|eukprot:CCA22392.1 conserved hypothetical protein [Albugo laibachii Nc14]